MRDLTNFVCLMSVSFVTCSLNRGCQSEESLIACFSWFRTSGVSFVEEVSRAMRGFNSETESLSAPPRRPSETCWLIGPLPAGPSSASERRSASAGALGDLHCEADAASLRLGPPSSFEAISAQAPLGSFPPDNVREMPHSDPAAPQPLPLCSASTPGETPCASSPAPAPPVAQTPASAAATALLFGGPVVVLALGEPPPQPLPSRGGSWLAAASPGVSAAASPLALGRPRPLGLGTPSTSEQGLPLFLDIPESVRGTPLAPPSSECLPDLSMEPTSSSIMNSRSFSILPTRRQVTSTPIRSFSSLEMPYSDKQTHSFSG
mmetsp:Transcript_73739/g.240156  ORF Transcript_73739/g.240156 Transcript_73739/m.240156 type:complete len:320 (-) Transcript_73739:2666-3625(-)